MPEPTFASLQEYVSNRGGKRAIRKVLVANNGIGAVKCIRSIRSWAYQVFGDESIVSFLAMATPEDLKANAEYIRMADHFEKVPGGTNNNNYANVSLIVEIAQRNNCDAVWAGWGHASENPKLPAALAAKGIVFVGPGAHAMQELGDKINSTILAQSVNVSCVPWSGSGIFVDYDKEGHIPKELMLKCMVTNNENVVEKARKIGFPLMIKASEGGGGKGIRKVEKEEDLVSAFQSVRGEVPGSPIFLMKLVFDSHHLEVQVLGDEHGNAISIYGRDCSIQRRHQKIIEEAPAAIADPVVFKKMEKAAVRLAQAVKYVGAGTVEYLYANGEYYFLELNPRLQVEHPCSELVSGVNLPAAQLNVAMGIPLAQIPCIRRMYGLEKYGDSDIDFETAEQVEAHGHVVACRITAENSSQGFKPSSGGISELTFRSTPRVWGYFSVQGGGSLHEFADSQFGHLFAWGENRDEARRHMIVALKELTIRGEIYTPVEYLVDLLETEDFKNNNIHTGWLDGLLASPTSIKKKPDPLVVVLCGAAYRAEQLSTTRKQVYLKYIERGQVPPTELIKNTEVFEMIYEDIKYIFTSKKFGDNKYFISVNKKQVEVDISTLVDGGLLICANDTSYPVYGIDEASGLRLTIRGQTCIFPKEYDPSNLRSATAGKLVRFLVKDGAEMLAGSPYAEIEVMKMYMPLICPEPGIIHFKLPIGSVLVGGEVIATLDLTNPELVKKSTLFEGTLPFDAPPHLIPEKKHQKLRSVVHHLETVLDGFQSEEIESQVNQLIKLSSDPSVPYLEFVELLSVLASRLPEQVVDKLNQILSSYYEISLKDLDESDSENVAAFPAQSIVFALDAYKKGQDEDEITAFSGVAQPIYDAAQSHIGGYLKKVVTRFLTRYLEVEELFQQRELDDVFCDLRHQHKDDLESIHKITVSRNPESQNGELIAILLDLVVQKDTEAYVDLLQQFATLTVKDSLEITVKARQLLIRYQLPSFKQRQVAIEENLRAAIRFPKETRKRISQLVNQSFAIFDVLVSFFNHSDVKVRNLALEVYLRRCYRAYDMKSINTVEDNDIIRSEWVFNSPNANSQESGVSSSSGGTPLEKKGSLRKVESVDNFLAQGINANLNVTRYGMMIVLSSVQHIYEQFEAILELFTPEHTTVEGEPLNVINISITTPCAEPNHEAFVSNLANFFSKYPVRLRELGVRRITIALSQGHTFPEYYTFRERLNFLEDPVCRHVEPTLAYHLEMKRLSNFDISYLPTENRQVHLYHATTKGSKKGDPAFSSCFFVRAIIRSGDTTGEGTAGITDSLISQAERVLMDAIKSLEVAVRDKRFSAAQNHHIFLRVLNEVTFEPASVENLLRTLGERYGRRLWKLRVSKLELAGKVKQGPSITPVRFVVTNPTSYEFEVEGYVEVRDSKTNATILSSFMGKPESDQRSISEPYAPADVIQRKRCLAQNHRTTYCHDFPALYKVAVKASWMNHIEHMKERGVAVSRPRCLMEQAELVLGRDGSLQEMDRAPGLNETGMVAWRLKLFTPSCPSGRQVILIANDITTQIGSFGPEEDDLFMAASQLARKEGIPRIYIACNSGARIGLAREVKESFRVKWKDPEDPTQGFEYLCVAKEDIEALLASGSVVVDGEDYRITDIIGKDHGLGVENLRGSGMIAGETSRAYEDIFTITHVTGRTVGIGAYLVRLGQRTIQTEAPIILTGASAINKLLGKEVYSSNAQLGGIQVMFRNGVSHVDVLDDYKGTVAIIEWLSYVPVKAGLQAPILATGDPVDREIEFMPTKTPYDIRHMLGGIPASENETTGKWVSGFFDEGSFMETLAGWAKTVICGRARLGGIPVGVIAVETRTVENVIPADPANPESQEQVQMQAGQVWFPDSAYKTAQAISDFNYGEGLPLIIFANWRGFSGGMRDMYNEILKYGAYIVDNLRKYKRPVLIYIPPFGELRGGAWVVLDPTINLEKMEMYCDKQGRGGVLEPNGTVEIKFRQRDLLVAMHRLDETLIDLEKQLAAEQDPKQQQVFAAKIASRVEELFPVYHQIAVQFADLHDTPGRMKAKRVIESVVEWKTSRTFFYHRLRRLLAEEKLREKIQKYQPQANHEETTQILQDCVSREVWESDKEFTSWAENPESLDAPLAVIRSQFIKAQLAQLYQLDSKAVEDILKDLRKK